MSFIEFETGKKYPKPGADVADNCENFRDAGYVLTEDDLVVDIDNISKEAIGALIVTFNIKTQTVWTERGVHFYFKKPLKWRRANLVCALGFPIEFKHGRSTKAVTIKRNGELRKIENQGVRENLPEFFASQKKYENLLGMNEGEGRNNKLYQHKLVLNNMAGWQSILKFINYHVFEDPLPIDEFETLSRAEIVPTGEKGGEHAVATYLIQKLNSLTYAGRFYFKADPESDYTDDEHLLNNIVFDVCGDVNTRYVDEVKKQMEYRSRKIPNDEVFKIKLKNGYLENGEFVPIVIDEFTPYSIEVDYFEDAEPVQIVDDYIDHLTNGDGDYKNLLLEVLGHTLIVNPEFKRLLAKFFIFVGSGGNGKGTLLQIIKSILDQKNCTGLSISELSDERYFVSFKGKLANLGDDIQDQAITDKDMKVLKNITTCDYISAREMYKNAESMYFTGSLIFTSNHLIKSFEKGKSYKRRVMWLPMYTEVDEDNKDPLFITKLTTPESIEYWISLIVAGYKRLYKNNGFTESEIVNKFNESYHKENNPYLTYLEDFTADDFIDQPIKEVNDDCKAWCEDNDIDFKRNMFIQTLKEILGIDNQGQKRINGKNTKVFRLID